MEEINADVLSFEARRKPIGLFEWTENSEHLLKNIENDVNKARGWYQYRDEAIVECANWKHRKDVLMAKVRLNNHHKKNPAKFTLSHSFLR